jgi:hypothetical protein
MTAADALARRAIGQAGGRVHTCSDAMWIGYSGMSWRSWGQELAIVARAIPGGARLWCCSRPRFATTLVDWGASGRAVDALCSAVKDLAPGLE